MVRDRGTGFLLGILGRVRVINDRLRVAKSRKKAYIDRRLYKLRFGVVF